MTKERAQITNSEGLAPPQPRSLRSRKRECPDDKMTLSDNAQPTLPQQDTEGNVTTAAATSPPQCPQSPLEECTKSSTQQDQAAEQSFPATQNSDTEEKYLVATSIAEHVMDKAVEGTGQGETLLTKPNNDSQLKDFRVQSSIDNQGGEEQEEEIKTPESNRSPSHTPTDQLWPSLPTSQEGDIGERDGQKEPNCVCMGDDKGKEITKEAVVGLPAKKKRRMGMCGLTEKERSNFLQTQKRKNGTEGGVRKSGNMTSDIVAQEEIIPSMSLSSSPLSIPVGRVTEQSEAEMKLQSRHCGREDRTQAEVYVAMTTSDVTNNVWNPFGQDPGCSEGETCQANPSVEPGPGQISDPGMDLPAETEGHLGSHSLIWEEQQEVEGSAAETTVEKYEKQTKEEEDGSGESDYYPATSFPTDTSKNLGTDGEHHEGNQTSHLQMARTRNGRMEEMGGEAWGGAVADTGASSTDARPQVFICSSEEICKAAVTLSGSEENGNCVPDYNPDTGPSPVSTEHPLTRDTTDPFGIGSLDYVSDSQLNNIVLIEEEVMEWDGGLGSSDCQEDATDLVCGLIRELSSLNRTVMATHRELENLRRGSKASRASIR